MAEYAWWNLSVMGEQKLPLVGTCTIFSRSNKFVMGVKIKEMGDLKLKGFSSDEQKLQKT